MSLKIGNILEALDAGRWVKVPTVSGIFGLKIKQLLPGEQYALSDKCKTLGDNDAAIAKERRSVMLSKIMDWKDLLDHDGKQIPFDRALLADENFINALFGCTVIGGGYLSTWLANKINKSDVFAEDEDTSFLAST